MGWGDWGGDWLEWGRLGGEEELGRAGVYLAMDGLKSSDLDVLRVMWPEVLPRPVTSLRLRRLVADWGVSWRDAHDSVSE